VLEMATANMATLRTLTWATMLVARATAQTYSIPTCCPKGQSIHLDEELLQCHDDPEQHEYSFLEELLPPFSSQHPAIVGGGIPAEEFEPPDPPPYELAAATGTPNCGDPEKFQVKYLVYGGNVISQADFVVDDLNLTRSPGLALLDMKIFEKYEDNYCLAVGRSSDGTFRGTAAAFCAATEKYDCSKRPCVSVCCESGDYFDPVAGGCRSELKESFPAVAFVEPKSLAPAQVSKSAVRYFFDRRPVGCQKPTMEENFVVLADSGDVFFASSGSSYRYTSYCVERVGQLGREDIDASALPLRAFVCPQGRRIVEETIIPILFIVSFLP
jgi:hypothetical protein